MIQVIDNHLAAENRPLLQSMFADRKRLFIDLFGWDVPVVDGQYEIDQFDNAHTVAEQRQALESGRDFHPTKLGHIAIARPVIVEILELFGIETIGAKIVRASVIRCHGGQLAASIHASRRRPSVCRSRKSSIVTMR